MGIPDFQTLMLPVLRVAAEGEVRISDVVERLADEFALTPEERSQLLTSERQTTFANRIHWAKSYLGKAGLVELTRRAHFCITDRGRKVLTSPPERIDIKFLGQFPEFQTFREVTEDDSVAAPAVEVASTLTPDEIMRSAHQQLDAALADDLLQRIHSGTPAFFESLVVRLLVAMGYGGSVTDVDKALVGGPAIAASTA
ncbi:winged helix-turn-helix domain-containing protein [Phaeovibrio sulfidiphilus]|uniref:winged helix-turn-helix domain-containing protein n=1 Tax=Phaeovibrio sulfidiphilus TaxID=1220600 RepID=UPI00308413D9